MTVLFSRILNMSMTGSIVILFVLAVRLLLKRTPKIFSYALWAVVLFRLLCPVSISAPVSLLGWLQPEVTDTTPVTSTVSYLSRGEFRNQAKDIASPQPVPTQPQDKETDLIYGLADIAACVWLTGAAAMALYSVVQYFLLRGRLVGAVLYRGEVYLSDYIASPFVMGILHPKVYLPSDTPKEERRYIIAHERHHIRRGDPLWKLLGYIALCIHWFNPLVWTAFLLAGRDMEMSCDEAVIKRLGEGIRRDYSASLLRFATHRKILSGMPLAFGEGDTKGRVLNMARWRRPRAWVSALCAAFSVVVLTACALNPGKADITGFSSRVSGPEDIRFSDLTFRLPEGLTYYLERKEEFSGNDHKEGFAGIISDGQNTIGGVQVFSVPENQILGQPDWLQSLDLWELGDDSLGYYLDNAPGGIYKVAFFNDVPTGDERKIMRLHTLFPYGNGELVYDVWFDELLINSETRQKIMSTIRVGDDYFISTEATAAVHIPEQEGNQPNREQHVELSFLVEGMEQACPATLYVGQDYSIYIPDGEWTYSSGSAGGLPLDLWESVNNQDVKLLIVNLGNVSFADAQLWVRAYLPSFDLLEDKQGGLGGLDEGDNLADIRFYPLQSSMFAVIQMYPMEASEGFGVRLRVIADTFEPTTEQ